MKGDERVRPFPMMAPYNGMYYATPPFDARYPSMGSPYPIPSVANMPQESYYQHGDFPSPSMQPNPYPMYQHPENNGIPPYGQVISAGYNQHYPYGPAVTQQQEAMQPYKMPGSPYMYNSAPPGMPKQMNGGMFSPFSNPLQPPASKQAQQAPYPYPYPKQGQIQNTQPSGFKSIMNQFKTQDGTIDVTKMMNTAGQMMGTVNQMQGMFKGLGSLLKFTT